MKGIESFSYIEDGMQRVYENDKWCVGIKNWKLANDINGITCLERHNTTDEMFTLIDGECTLIQGEDCEEGGMNLKLIAMERGRLYVIPKSMWHNTITKKGTKLLLIEDSNCSGENSDIYNLSNKEIADIKRRM